MYDILSVFRLVCFVRLRASGTSVWQEYKVIQTIHDALAKFKSFFRGVSLTYRLPSLNLAIAPRSANSALA